MFLIYGLGFRHWGVYCCRSEHFRALFYGGLKEANDKESTPIPIEGIKHEVNKGLGFINIYCL